MKQEIELFRWRFQLEPISSVINFLRLNNFVLPAINAAEKQEIASDLAQSLTMSVNTVHKMEIFKVWLDLDYLADLVRFFRYPLKKFWNCCSLIVAISRTDSLILQ